MNQHEIDQLIQSALDDSATAEDRTQLDALLAADESVRRRHRDLSALFQTLGRMPLLAAPANLAEQVRAAIPAKAPPGARSGWAARGGWSALRESWSRPPAARLAFAFAAGLAVGAIAFANWNGTLAGRSPAGLERSTGTMSPSAATSPGEALEWNLAGTVVRVRSAGARSVMVEVTGRGPAEVTIERAEPDVAVAAIRSTRPATSHMSIEPGRVRLTGEAGTTFELELVAPATAGAPLHVGARAGASSATGDLPARAGPPAEK